MNFMIFSDVPCLLSYTLGLANGKPDSLAKQGVWHLADKVDPWHELQVILLASRRLEFSLALECFSVLLLLLYHYHFPLSVTLFPTQKKKQNKTKGTTEYTCKGSKTFPTCRCSDAKKIKVKN
eukprot:TRINITY_DN29449_c2_g1_i1.p1 TRINITY_DN29449_c2_g1~~TRINITY_DN29449_c2_g1_i1.p1  ORF type:complete len:123 (-),score=2.64 TRINITY_DN29449_c2_g1_i1:478-846(-)